jgi:hypothetical protein
METNKSKKQETFFMTGRPKRTKQEIMLTIRRSLIQAREAKKAIATSLMQEAGRSTSLDNQQ